MNATPHTHIPDDDLVAHLDGELSPDRAAEVASELARCDECRRQSALFAESAALLARLPAPAPSDGFAARVVAASQAQSSTKSGGRVLALRRPLLQAAAAVLLAVGVVAWSTQRADRTTPDTLHGEPEAAEVVLTSDEEEAIAEEMLLLGALDFLEDADADELKILVEDLDVLDQLAADDPDVRSGG